MKKNPLAPIFAIVALVLAGVFTSAWGAVPQSSEIDVSLATVDQYCLGCHNDRALVAGVSFEGLTEESIGEHADVFELAVRKLRGRVMPPPGAPQPEDEAVSSLVAWIEDALDAAEGQDHLLASAILPRGVRRARRGLPF